MGQRLAGGGIGVGADVRFGDQVVREALGERRGRETDRRRGQPVERVVTKSLAEIGVGVAARQRIAETVVGEAQNSGLRLRLQSALRTACQSGISRRCVRHLISWYRVGSPILPPI
jgi:hypothetical protein